MSWSSTDAISLCFLLLGLTDTINIIIKKQDPGLLRIIGYGLLFCMPFFFRYMYLPIAILFPFFVLAFGFLLKSRVLKIVGSKLLFTSVLFLIVLFSFSLSTSGNALFVHDFGRGIFFGQLTKWYPFLPASFINLDFAAQLTERIAGITYGQMMVFASIANPVIFLLLVILLCRYILAQKKKFTLSAHFLFIILGSFIGLTIIFLIAYLTLTYKAIPWGYSKWTHSQHPRYFAFIYAFIPLLLIVCLQHYASFFKNFFIRAFTFIALSCLAIETLHGIYYNIKIVANHKDLALIRDADKGYRTFNYFIEEIKKQNPGREI